MVTAKQNDFVEISYTGYANGDIFDSNIPEDLKTLDPEGKSKPEKTVICIGQKMLVPGLDKQLEGKEIDKEYNVEVKSREAFGDRKREMIRIIPLKAFTEQKLRPQTGMMFTLDNALVKVIAVSGARVTVDFNNPLAGKDLTYKIKITRIVTDEKEKTEALLKVLLKFVPEFEIKEKIIIKGPKVFEGMVKLYSPKFKELIGKELSFEEKKPETDKKENLEDKLATPDNSKEDKN